MVDTGLKQAMQHLNALSSDSVCFLFQDVCGFPIITSRYQDMWLGIQIKAVNWVNQLSEKDGEYSTTLENPSRLSQRAYRILMDYQSRMKVNCLEKLGVNPPRLNAWAAESLLVRHNIFELRRSRVGRFIRTLKNKGDKENRQMVIEIAYDIAELLCLLPDSALNYFIEFDRDFERSPSIDEMSEWLETYFVSNHLPKLVRQRAKLARDTLVTGYLRYAIRMARNYVEQGLDYEDLVQEGFVGLIKAAERYNYREHPRFAHYATTWLWQNLNRSIADQGRTIRLPVHLCERVGKVEEAFEFLVDKELDCPTCLDILRQMNLLSDGDIEIVQKLGDRCLSLPKRCTKALRRIKKLMIWAQPTIPLELIIPDGIKNNIFMHNHYPVQAILADVIPDLESCTTEYALDLIITKDIIEQAFQSLTPREQSIIELRFGFRDGEGHTLEEIGQKFNVTRERIRQLEQRAVEKLARIIPKGCLATQVASARSLLSYLPAEVQAYLDEEFNHWRPKVLEKHDQDRAWLDSLIDQLPGGHWHRSQSTRGMTRREQLVETLCILSAPAHYSEITEQINDTLEDELDEKYVYSLLMRYEETFILLGQGVFGLLEWEKNRGTRIQPLLPFCPTTLPDPPHQSDAFFESVLIARDVLKYKPRTDQFLKDMFDWAGIPVTQPGWLQQSVLSAYYLVGLVPYVFCLDGNNLQLECTLPEMELHELRHHCLQKLTERLMAMPEFLWTFQRYQPTRPSELGEQFIEVHPLGLDDAINRLGILTSLGASQKLTYGRYRLTSLGEQLADKWKQRPSLMKNLETIQDPQPKYEPGVIDLAFW